MLNLSSKESYRPCNEIVEIIRPFTKIKTHDTLCIKSTLMWEKYFEFVRKENWIELTNI